MSVAATVATAVCVTWTYVAVAVVVRRRTFTSPSRHAYRDEDGDALAVSQADSSPGRLDKLWLPALSSGILLFAAFNFATEGFDSRLGMIMSGWIMVEIDAVLLAREPSQQARFPMGIWLASSSCALSIALLLGTNDAFPNHILYWAQFGLGAALSLLACSLPRRPDVYYDKRLVDRQMTCSAAQRITFSWIRPLLDQARSQRTVEYDDLPVLGQAARSQDLKARFPSNQLVRQPLWRVIVSHHYPAVYQQWLTAILESFASVTPPISMFMILSLMEARTPGQIRDNSMIWFWIICLAVSKSLHVGLASWLQWASFALFAIPVRSQLSALIFAKSLRMTHSNEAKAPEDKVPRKDGSDDENEDAVEMDTFLSKEDKDEKEEEEADVEEKTEAATTGIVNLLGVDVARVAEFCGYNQDLLRGLVKVTIAASLLFALIGWKSTLAGFAVPVILQPINRIATKYYTSKQLEVMAARDNKAHVITEALHGIRQIKFSATETEWEQRILAARERELKAQWSVYVWAIFLTFVWIAMPALIGAAALSIYAWTSKQMIASVAFTALSIFSSLEWTIGAVPTTITEMLDARVSANRIQEHLNAEERHETTKPGDKVVFKNASIAWPSKSWTPEPLLHGLNLRFPPNELSVISGKTGTGKSLLLAAIIGDAELIEGEIQVPRAPPMHMRDSEHATSANWIIPSAIAFVGQVPWIENASVKDTVLYGLPYNRERYRHVIHACALVDDIKMLPDGEHTEVGATGINLSGGQRWRITFARALYSRAGILILDDIFSAVDSHVGRHLLDHAILGPLGTGRTKILVTHHIGLVQRYAACHVTLTGSGTAKVESRTPQRPTEALTAIPEIDSASTPDAAVESEATKPMKFVEDESRSQGRVKWTIYKTYLQASGGLGWGVLTLGVFSIAALSTVARSYWLTVWTQAYTSSEDTTGNSTPASPNLVFYLSVYLLITTVSISLVAIKITLVLVASLRAARRLFKLATLNVLRARMRWLDTQPIGRILNRFVGDFALVDSKLGGDMTWCANGIFSILTIVLAALSISFWMIVPVILLTLVCVGIVYLFIDASRDIKRLESTSKSPIHELVSSALSGLPVIRSFNRVDTYMLRMYGHIDRYCQTSWYVLLASQWMRFRQGILGMIFTLCIATGVAYFPNIDASLAGFALSFALDFSDVAEKTINRYTATELNMNSMERVSEYLDLGTESTSGAQAPKSWPSNGHLIVRDLEVGYAEHLESVLKGISFSVQPRQRIGIVGRTGSGKSSLMLSLFRFLEARKGSIEVDGLELSSLRLHDIRSRLTIIPQDPVLFSGTLRSNLDLFDEHTDGVLLEALQRVTPVVAQSDSSAVNGGDNHSSNIFRNLSFPITRGGSNLSQGEKQLICLARAIVARPKILVLDEATSAVDMETDALIQRSIRQEFRNSTLIVVAHRLSTVADFDKILVMRDGRVAEYDTPKALAKDKGLFWQMCNQSGEKEALKDLLQ